MSQCYDSKVEIFFSADQHYITILYLVLSATRKKNISTTIFNKINYDIIL